MPRGKKKRQRNDWDMTFEHAGRSIFVTGSALKASGEAMVRGAVREENYGRAEIALLGNTVMTVEVDGEKEFDRDRGSRGDDIPSYWDPETEETSAEVLLTYIVTKIAPHMADQYKDCFDRYYDEEAMSELQSNTADLANPTPLRRTPEGSTKSPIAGEM